MLTMKKLLKIVLAGVLAVSMAVMVCACNKIFKLCHPLRRVSGKVGVNVVVVLDSVWRTCRTFYHCRMVRRNAVTAVVCLCGMLQKTCVPNVAVAERLDAA